MFKRKMINTTTITCEDLYLHDIEVISGGALKQDELPSGEDSSARRVYRERLPTAPRPGPRAQQSPAGEHGAALDPGEIVNQPNLAVFCPLTIG